MLKLYCPHCAQEREEEEFAYAGEAFIVRPDESVDDPTWGNYLFMRTNPKGWLWEQWQHTAACRKVFAVRRHTATYEVDVCLSLEAGKTLFDQEMRQEAPGSAPGNPQARIPEHAVRRVVQ